MDMERSKEQWKEHAGDRRADGKAGRHEEEEKKKVEIDSKILLLTFQEGRGDVLLKPFK